MTKKGLKIYSDGGARGNPGPAAAAFVAILEGKVIYKKSKYLGIKTNNFAEYSGVFMAFNWLTKENELKGDRAVVFYLDSELVAKQLLGKYKVKNKTLKPFVSKIKKMENTLDLNISYEVVPRDKNKLADFLVNEVLNEKS